MNGTIHPSESVHLYLFLYICTVCVQEATVTKDNVKPSVEKKSKDNRKMRAKFPF